MLHRDGTGRAQASVILAVSCHQTSLASVGDSGCPAREDADGHLAEGPVLNIFERLRPALLGGRCRRRVDAVWMAVSFPGGMAAAAERSQLALPSLGDCWVVQGK